MGCPESGWKARPEETTPSSPSVSFSFRIFCSFSFSCRARPHSPPLALSRPSSLFSRAQSGIGGGEGGIPSKESLGAILERRGGEPHIDRPTKKEKGTLPSLLLPKRDGSLLPPYWHLAAWKNFGKSSRYVPWEEG